MSVKNRSFKPVRLVKLECPCAKYHFHGLARCVYTYLEKLAANHGGFVFASVDDIVRHTKRWSKETEGSKSQVERILRILRVLRILGDRETRTIHGREYEGWQFASHSFWATAQDGVCDFRFWAEFANDQRKCMGNEKVAFDNDGRNDGQNDGRNDGHLAQNDGRNDGHLAQNDGQNDGHSTIVPEPNLAATVGL